MRNVMLFFLFSLLSFSACAGGEKGGDSSVIDLVPPTINFLIFAAILYRLSRNPIKNHFFLLAERVAAVYEKARVRKREADERWDESERKMENFSQKATDVLSQTEKKIKDFETRHQGEMKDKITKFKEDSQTRLKAEETTLVNELNRELVETVLTKTKSSFARDSSLRARAAEELTKDIS